ncbi:hypothetical protein ME784_11760 [Lactobacillus delbrueckii]|nr:hypothetical protein ME784_11760 [Lactobacillus delbrueckii]GHN22483.1 hypothetical protein ME785_10410 [Lactobacillus delbrueckii]GHN62014.1 hypothetical protein ME807_04210 [Lactobacillus delbrueckii]
MESFTLFVCIASGAGCREYELRKVIVESEYKTGHGYPILFFLYKKVVKYIVDKLIE